MLVGRDPQVGHRRRRLPRRHVHLRALARRRARHARHPQRALPQVLQLVRDRRPRPEAADPVDARHARHRRRRRLAVGDGDARARSARCRAGRARTRSRRSRWCTQIRAVLSEYEARGGRVEMTMYEELRPLPAAGRARALVAAVLRVSWRPRDPWTVRRRARVRGPARLPGRRRDDHRLRARGRRPGRAREAVAGLPAGRARASSRRGRPATRAARPGWTGRSRTSACCCSTSAAPAAPRPVTGRESAEYLTHFRADNIVRDCEAHPRGARLAAVERARPELRRDHAPDVPVVRARRACARR